MSSSLDISSSSSSKVVTDPTFNDSKADVILRSSDGIDFRMHKSLLSFASTFFEGMFDLPQPASGSGDEVVDGLPVVRLPENSQTLKQLLLFCHPAHAPQLQNLEEVHDVLGPAIKYDMMGAIKRIGQMLRGFTVDEPLRAFCIAWQYKLEEEVRFAAKHNLNRPMFPRTWVRELELITAGTLHRLEEYHFKCGKAAKAVATSHTWIVHGSLIQFGAGCWKCSQGQSVSVTGGQIPARAWWTEYMQEAGNALMEKPRGATVKSPELISKALRKANECAQCRERVFVEMTEFCELFAEQVEKVVSTMSLKVEF
ncbi:hypothetical protein BDN72DRAFT_837686 [Pluteus cervinus]|uniref:Uncharacterized protein n=1 Tax=Pluteus cervinus TaxID=181527 RepID=A0ACD3B1F0_9AGAR|nr:hypothetical protein BDN72DRAFT_837686 [Pluteus cervinus]